MKYHAIVTVPELQLGDIVRTVNGGMRQVQGQWVAPEIFGPDDFRHAYDSMTVVRVNPDGSVDFARPYVHVWGDEKTEAPTKGVEDVNNVSTGHYELLGCTCMMRDRMADLKRLRESHTGGK